MTRQIQLTQGKFALVDDEDYEYINQWNWCYSQYYAIRNKHWVKECGKRTSKNIRMHRIINKTPPGLITDHINGNGLDNRKENLRTCTYSENSMNSKKRRNTSSQFKGVCFYRNKYWRAYIKSGKKRIELGYFSSEIDAAKAYNEAALIHYGEFVYLNNLEGEEK